MVISCLGLQVGKTAVNRSEIVGADGYICPEYRDFGDCGAKSDMYGWGESLVARFTTIGWLVW